VALGGGGRGRGFPALCITIKKRLFCWCDALCRASSSPWVACERVEVQWVCREEGCTQAMEGASPPVPSCVLGADTALPPWVGEMKLNNMQANDLAAALLALHPQPTPPRMDHSARGVGVLSFGFT
jgi:hypothetical protein